MKKVKLAVVGVGNCASSLIQGIEYYKHHHNEHSDGIMQPQINELAQLPTPTTANLTFFIFVSFQIFWHILHLPLFSYWNICFLQIRKENYSIRAC